jgi:hypothetical protein
MSLTVALAILAALVLVGVVAQGAWAARRATPRQHLPDHKGDRHEPTLGGNGAALEGPDASLDGAAPLDEPGLGDVPAAARPPAPVIRRSVRIDALIDAIATITPDALVTGDLALQQMPPTRRAGGKPFQVEGLNANTGEWEAPRAGQRYSEFQAGLQMANRSGALNEIEYSEFVQKIQPFADGLSARVDFPDMLEVVARARELDQFASQHDAQLCAVLRANSVAWALGYVQQCAARHGFVPGAVPGRLVLPSHEEAAPPILVLSFDSQVALQDETGQAALRELQISLDVAQTPETGEPFASWQECARRLADDLDATLVDDRGAPITLHAFATIGQELERLYRSLDSHELAAGTPAARRLFS